MDIQGPFPPALRGLTAPASPPAQQAAREARNDSNTTAAQPPSLWDVLTPAEREFFTELETLGSLTYRPGARRDPTPAPTGQRIDVRG